jgi:hypothetical protein
MPFAGWLGLVVALVELQGAPTCPTPDQIAGHLRGLLPEATAPKQRVSLANDGGALLLALDDGTGRAVAHKRLEPAPCDDLAQAAAVVIAAWAMELSAAGAPEVVLPHVQPRRIGWDLHAGFVASLAGASFAPGGELGLLLGRPGGRVLGHLIATGFATRDLQVGNSSTAHASFTRASLGLGPLVRFRPGRFRLDLDGELSVALVYLAGVGFADDTSSWDVDVGLGGGGRAAVRLGPVAPYLGARVVGWLRPLQASTIGPTGGATPLPRFEVLLSAGISFGQD